MKIIEHDEDITIELEGTEVFRITVDDVEKYKVINNIDYKILLTLKKIKVLIE